MLQLVQCSDFASQLQQALQKCDGSPFNPAVDQLVTCAAFDGLISAAAPNVICDLLAAVNTDGGVADATTRLLGPDCRYYTLPQTVVDINVADYSFDDATGELVLSETDGSEFRIPASQLFPVIKKCGGADFSYTNDEVATCNNLTDVVPPTATANGRLIETNGDTVVVPNQVQDCSGNAIDLTNRATQLASCADLQALIDRVAAMESILAAAEEIQDCNGTVVGYYLTSILVP